jgi:hypothetical protein
MHDAAAFCQLLPLASSMCLLLLLLVQVYREDIGYFEADWKGD